MAHPPDLPRGVFRSQVGWKGTHLEWREGRWRPVAWRQKRSRGHAVVPLRMEPLPGAEQAPRCDCGRRAVWRASWRCEACGRARLTGYGRWVLTPRGVSAGAAHDAPIFRSQEETNCDTAGAAGPKPPDWLEDVEWLTSWSRRSRAARLGLRGLKKFGVVSGWHRDRIRGVGERFARVRACGADTGLEWVERADEHGEVVSYGEAKRFPHRTACGQWRVCTRCLKRRRDKLREGVTAQRALALQLHHDKLQRRYAGDGGRWCERLITFTVPHKDLAEDVAILPKLWRKIEAPLRRHLKERGIEERPVYVRSIEVAGTNHAHLHVWQLGPYVEHAMWRVWWGGALESFGYAVPRRDVADVVADARDARAAEWLSGYSDVAGTLPWPVVDVRASQGGRAAKYVAKVGAAVALYAAKQGEYVRLEPVHAARVYEALEGVRVTQWARGWAPPRNRSFRWQLRRISQLTSTVTERGGVAEGAGLAGQGCGRTVTTGADSSTMGRFRKGVDPP